MNFNNFYNNNDYIWSGEEVLQTFKRYCKYYRRKNPRTNLQKWSWISNPKLQLLYKVKKRYQFLQGNKKYEMVCKGRKMESNSLREGGVAKIESVKEREQRKREKRKREKESGRKSWRHFLSSSIILEKKTDGKWWQFSAKKVQSYCITSYQ